MRNGRYCPNNDPILCPISDLCSNCSGGAPRVGTVTSPIFCPIAPPKFPICTGACDCNMPLKRVWNRLPMSVAEPNSPGIPGIPTIPAAGIAASPIIFGIMESIVSPRNVGFTHFSRKPGTGAWPINDCFGGAPTASAISLLP